MYEQTVNKDTTRIDPTGFNSDQDKSVTQKKLLNNSIFASDAETIAAPKQSPRNEPTPRAVKVQSPKNAVQITKAVIKPHSPRIPTPTAAKATPKSPINTQVQVVVRPSATPKATQKSPRKVTPTVTPLKLEEDILVTLTEQAEDNTVTRKTTIKVTPKVVEPKPKFMG